MLFLHPESRAHLHRIRTFMYELDHYGFNEHNIEPHFQLELETKLQYLNEYGCAGADGTHESFNRFSNAVFAAYEREFNFGLVWKKPGDGTLHLPILGLSTPLLVQSQWHILNDFYQRQTMNGGLIFHGPKKLFGPAPTKEQLDSKNSWMVHT